MTLIPLWCPPPAGTADPSPSHELAPALLPGSSLYTLPHLHSHIPQMPSDQKEYRGSLASAQGGAQEAKPEAAPGGPVGRRWGQPPAVCAGGGGS